MIIHCFLSTDTDAELDLLRTACKETGASDAVVSKHWSSGSKGAVDLAKALVAACEQPSNFKFLYNLNLSIKEKIEIISREMYGAGEVVYSEIALKKMKQYEEQVFLYTFGLSMKYKQNILQGFGNLTICMGKTPLSLTADPTIKGAPTGFTLPITDMSISVGAEFIIPLTGTVRKINYAFLKIFYVIFVDC